MVKLLDFGGEVLTWLPGVVNVCEQATQTCGRFTTVHEGASQKFADILWEKTRCELTDTGRKKLVDYMLLNDCSPLEIQNWWSALERCLEVGILDEDIDFEQEQEAV